MNGSNWLGYNSTNVTFGSDNFTTRVQLEANLTCAKYYEGDPNVTLCPDNGEVQLTGCEAYPLLDEILITINRHLDSLPLRYHYFSHSDVAMLKAASFKLGIAIFVLLLPNRATVNIAVGLSSSQ